MCGWGGGGCGGDFGVADCYVAGVVFGYLDGPLCANSRRGRFEKRLDLFEGVEVVSCEGELGEYQPVEIRWYSGILKDEVCSSYVLLNLAHFWGELEARNLHLVDVVRRCHGASGINFGKVGKLCIG